MAAFATSVHQTCIPLPSDCGAGGKHPDHQTLLSLVPIHIHVVTHASQLPTAFLFPSSETQMVVGFDCEGVDLCRYGKLCIVQFAFPDAIYIVDAIQGGESLMTACKPALSLVTSPKLFTTANGRALYFQYGIKLYNIVDTQERYLRKKGNACQRNSTSSDCGRRQYYIKAAGQLAYYLIEEQQGQKKTSDAYISFVSFLADHR